MGISIHGKTLVELISEQVAKKLELDFCGNLACMIKGMNLVIVESPTKARTLGRFLGSEFQIEATMGHVRDLPQKRIGLEVNGLVKMDYQIIPKNAVRVKELEEKARGADQIYLATDPDREGEAIAFHVAELLKEEPRIKNQETIFKRIVFHEITEGAIKNALEHPRELDMQLVDAQQARRALDRLVGYKLSPLLWRKVRRGLSAGRVQSVAVRLIVEKEREIEKFVPEEYWLVQVEVAPQESRIKNQESNNFWVMLVEINNKKEKTMPAGRLVENGEEAAAVVADLEQAIYQVAGVERKEVQRTPPPPFTTSTLQQQASHKLGLTAKRTMQLAQGLYEEGLITYHRTDSTNLAKEAVLAAKNVIESMYGNEFALPSPRFYKTKSKVAQEAHEAVRPTDPERNQVEGEGARVYELIWKRFMACQMAEAVMDTVRVSVSGKHEDKNYGLEAKGETMKFAGWLAVYGADKNKKEKSKNDNGEFEETLEEQVLPEVVEGENLDKLQVKSEQKFTQPPARYSEATLIKALEELGIGRPSTYAPIITTIIDRWYVEREQRRLKPTVLGEAVNGFLMENFGDIMDYKFTAKMEDDLDEIANGKLNWQAVVKDFYSPFAVKLESVGEKAGRVKVETEKTGEKCPKCGQGDVVIRLGRFGKFLSCSRFPECDYKANYRQVVEGMKCPKDGGDIVIKRTRSGKSFYGCSNWPKCDFASWTKPKLATEKETSETEVAENDAV